MSRLLADKEFCFGDRFTMADVATGTVIRYLDVRWPENPWRLRYPNLSAFSDRMERRPSFAGSVPYAQVIRDRVA